MNLHRKWPIVSILSHSLAFRERQYHMHRVKQGHWSCLPLHLGMSLGDQLGMGEGHLGALNDLGDYLGILLRQKYKIIKFNFKLRE